MLRLRNSLLITCIALSIHPAIGSAKILFQDNETRIIDGFTRYTVPGTSGWNGATLGGIVLDSLPAGTVVNLQATISNINITGLNNGSSYVYFRLNNFDDGFTSVGEDPASTPQPTGPDFQPGVLTRSATLTGTAIRAEFGRNAWGSTKESENRFYRVTISNLCIFTGSACLNGPSAVATGASMSVNSASLKQILSLQTSLLNPGLSYDCSLFDTRGICLSFGGKRTNTSGDGGDATAGVLVAGYRLNPNIRIGGFFDQRTGTTTAPGLRLRNSNPELGLYAVWAQKSNNEGLYARAALRFGKNDITITRPDVVDSEPGEGTAKFESQAAQITVGRGYRIAQNWVAAPHVGLRYVNIQRGSYSEAEVAGVVDNPLTYSRLKQESYTGVLGVAFTGDIAERTRATFTAGIDRDFRNRISDYSATGVTELTAIKFDDKGLRKTRPVVSAEFAYSLDKTSQISAKITYREEAFKSITTVTGFVNYTKGF